jgi:hypothetical protein
MIIRARSYTDLISFFRAIFNRRRMLLCTADGSGLFLPYRFGKLVMMVSAESISLHWDLGTKAVIHQSAAARSRS